MSVGSESEFEVREMQSEEASQVKSLFKSNLKFIDKLVFLMVFGDVLKAIKKGVGTCLVAISGGDHGGGNDDDGRDNGGDDGDANRGKIVGTVSLHYVTIHGQKHGLVDALATDKSMRGKGIAASMITKAIEWFHARGCTEIYATVDRYNSSSWNMFMHHGFQPYEVHQQIKDFGVRFLKLWAAESYFIGIGTFFVKYNRYGENTNDSSSSSHSSFSTSSLHQLSTPKGTNSYIQMGFAIFGMVFAWMLIIFRAGGDFRYFLPFLLIVGISIIVHELSHVVIAKSMKIDVVFKTWHPGLLFNYALAFIFGGYYPAYGSTYIKQVDWSYDRELKKSGVIYIFGPIMTAFCAIGCLLLSNSVSDPNWLLAANIGYNFNIISLILNLLPLKGAGGFAWDGGKLFKWSKKIWFTLTIGLFAIIITVNLMLSA